jgi:hypothetical protein
VRISFARPLILDHSATGTRRQWNFIDFYRHKFPVHLGGPPFIKAIDSNGTFARVAAAGANQPALRQPRATIKRGEIALIVV